MNNIEINNRLNPIRRKWSKKISKLGCLVIIIPAAITTFAQVAPYIKIHIFENFLVYFAQILKYGFWLGLPTAIIGILLMPDNESQEENGK